MKAFSILTTLVASALFALSPAPAQAQQTLRVSTYLPTTHWLVSEALKNWAASVEEETKGQIRINILPTPLGRPQQQFDLARDGVADIVLGVPGFTPGRFLMTSVSGVPGAGHSSESIAAALWRTLQKSPEMQREFDGVVPIGVFSTTPMGLWTSKREVANADDLRGLKVHTSGGMMSDVSKALSMVPVVQPPGAAYELLAGGVVDGIIFTADGMASFRLDRVIGHGLLVPGGFTSTSGYLAMNSAKFNALTPELRAALMRVSGERFARLIGRIWDDKDAKGIDAMKAGGGKVKDADAALLKALNERTEVATQGWIDEVKAKRGVDGAALLTAFRAEVRAIEVEQKKR